MLKRNLILAVTTIALSLSFAMTANADMLTDDAKKSAADSLQKITEYLASNQFVASRMELKELDADPVPELIAVAADKRQKSFVRERAIKSLSMFRDARVKTAFTDLLGKNRRNDELFGMIVMSYLEAFGEDAVGDLQPYLTHKDASVRTIIARGFGMFGGQTGYDLLVEHNRTEQDARVLQAMRPFVQ